MFLVHVDAHSSRCSYSEPEWRMEDAGGPYQVYWWSNDGLLNVYRRFDSRSGLQTVYRLSTDLNSSNWFCDFFLIFISLDKLWTIMKEKTNESSEFFHPNLSLHLNKTETLISRKFEQQIHKNGFLLEKVQNLIFRIYNWQQTIIGKTQKQKCPELWFTMPFLWVKLSYFKGRLQ